MRKDKKEVNHGRKTAGGILMEMVRKECGLTNQQKKKIFCQDSAYQNQKKKMKVMLDKMLLS